MTKAEKIERIKTSKPVKPMDFVIFALLIVLTAALFIAAYSNDEEPNYVRIYYNNTLKELKLDKDESYPVKDEDGNILLTVVIEDGIVSVIDSACRDHICEKTRIKNAGFQIICLPGGIVVKITGDSWFDGIVG